MGKNVAAGCIKEFGFTFEKGEGFVNGGQPKQQHPAAAL